MLQFENSWIVEKICLSQKLHIPDLLKGAPKRTPPDTLRVKELFKLQVQLMQNCIKPSTTPWIHIKCEPKKCYILGQKLAINQKSLKFTLHSWNLVKMTSSCANHFDQVSWLLEKDCDFFIKTNIWT